MDQLLAADVDARVLICFQTSLPWSQFIFFFIVQKGGVGSS